MRKLFISIIFFPFLAYGNGCLETRAALALHTNHARLVIAEVDKCKSTISKYFLEMDTTLDLISGIRKKDYLLTLKLQGYAINTLEKLAKNAREFRPKNLILVPSKSLKKMKNYLEFFKEIQKAINCKIVLPNLETESILGFLAAKLKVPKSPIPLMSWTINDSGTFWVIEDQIGGFKTFYEKLSPFIFKDMIIEGVLKKDHLKVSSPNPLGLEKVTESEKLLEVYAKYNLDKFLQEKSSNYNVIGIGNFYSHLGETINGLLPLDQLRTSLVKTSNFSDDQIGGEFPDLQITNLILAIKMMETMGISKVTPVSVNEADGSLVFEDFWKAS
jgi:hypothetical protein